MHPRTLARPLLIGVLGLTTLVGCTSGDPKAAATPGATWAPATSAAPAPTVSPTAGSTTPATEALTAKGIAKYLVGAKLTVLAPAKLLVGQKKAPGCPDWVTAKGTGAYAGIDVIFYKGAIAWVDAATPGYATEKGISLGSTYDQVVAAYPSGVKLDDGLGGKAISAHDGTNALFFRFDNTNSTVTSIEAGKAETLEFRFTDGEGC
jgi:hypothetical protein